MTNRYTLYIIYYLNCLVSSYHNINANPGLQIENSVVILPLISEKYNQRIKKFEHKHIKFCKKNNDASLAYIKSKMVRTQIYDVQSCIVDPILILFNKKYAGFVDKINEFEKKLENATKPIKFQFDDTYYTLSLQKEDENNEKEECIKKIILLYKKFKKKQLESLRNSCINANIQMKIIPVENLKYFTEYFHTYKKILLADYKKIINLNELIKDLESFKVDFSEFFDSVHQTIQREQKKAKVVDYKTNSSITSELNDFKLKIDIIMENVINFQNKSKDILADRRLFDVECDALSSALVHILDNNSLMKLEKDFLKKQVEKFDNLQIKFLVLVFGDLIIDEVNLP